MRPPVHEAIPLLVKDIYRTGIAPRKRAIQKIVYLLSAAGVDLGFTFQAHLFGPYSGELSECMDSLWMQGYLRFLSHDGVTEIVPGSLADSIDENCVPEEVREAYRDTGRKLLAKLLEPRAYSNLEDLATVHFIVQHGGSAEWEEVAGHLRAWKGEEISRPKLEDTLALLRDLVDTGQAQRRERAADATPALPVPG